MSEKFVVGQWVTWNGRPYSVERIDNGDGTVLCNSGAEGSEPVWIRSCNCNPFVWQVGKTYKTTLAGVNATITRIGHDNTLYGPVRGDDDSTYAWVGETGLLFGLEDAKDRPHILPYLADEPPLVAEAATYSEFEDGDEREGPDALQSLLTEFSHRREQCQRMAESWETKAAEWRKAEQMIVEAIERAKR